MYKQKNEEYGTNSEKVQDIMEIIEIYGYIYYFIGYDIIPLYEDEDVSDKDLCDLSHSLKPNKTNRKISRWKKLKTYYMKKNKVKEEEVMEYEFVNPLYNH